MSSIFLLLQKVHENVHDSSMKLDYSEPKLFTGGVDITQWSKLSKSKQKEALNRDWYVYYSFRDPKTGRLKRQTNIKGGVNRTKDKRIRYHILKVMKASLKIILSEGYNPYKGNLSLVEYLKQNFTGKKMLKPICLKKILVFSLQKLK